MLLWSSAMFSGVAPPSPGSSTGSVSLPLYCGDPSSSREIVVPISSTWLISSVPIPWIRSRYGFADGPAEVDALEQVLHHRAHLAELAAEALLQRVRGCGVRLVLLDLVDESLHVEVHDASVFGDWSSHSATVPRSCQGPGLTPAAGVTLARSPAAAGAASRGQGAGYGLACSSFARCTALRASVSVALAVSSGVSSRSL